MTRIAWFTPLSSSPTSLPCHRTALLARLQDRYTVDRFIGTPSERLHNLPPRTFSAYDFVWKQILSPYDLTVYDVADSPCYDFVWPYLMRYPGLVVLHDDRFHRSRARMLVTQGHDAGYHAEFHYDHPEASPDIPELGIERLLGATSELWPMRRVVIESSRLVVAANAWIAETLKAEASHDRIEVIEPAAPKVDPSPETRERIRSEHGIAAGTVVFAMVGPLAPECRADLVWSALALLRHDVPPLHLLIYGEADDSHRRMTRQLDITERVTWIGNTEATDLSDVLSAADVCVCLGWPSGRRAMMGLVESLAAAKPSLVTDLADRVDIPSLDPRDWHLRPLASAHGEPGGSLFDAACVSIDILDENHSLQLAMSRLAADPALRAKLGRGAQALWQHRFTFDRLERDFELAITRALNVSPSEVRQAALPAHLRADGTGLLRSLLAPFGVWPPGLSDLAPAASHEVPSES
jgi:glycosyltransferase involved in cell wall biosynthesis